MSEHEHDFGDARQAPIGSVRPCRVGDCTEWAVRRPRLVRWDALTPSERLDLMAIQMEDIAIAQAMQIIHGQERGLRRARQVLGYDRYAY